MTKFDRVMKRVHPQVERGLRVINLCIIDFLISQNGESNLDAVEKYTGLHHINTNIVADMIRFMVEEGSFILRNGKITASVAKLKLMVEQEKTLLPKRHCKLWSEEDYIRLSQLQIEKTPALEIANRMSRTEQSISMQSTLLRKAFRLIPIIENNSIVRDFASIQVSPNPKE